MRNWVSAISTLWDQTGYQNVNHFLCELISLRNIQDIPPLEMHRENWWTHGK